MVIFQSQHCRILSRVPLPSRDDYVSFTHGWTHCITSRIPVRTEKQSQPRDPSHRYVPCRSTTAVGVLHYFALRGMRKATDRLTSVTEAHKQHILLGSGTISSLGACFGFGESIKLVEKLSRSALLGVEHYAASIEY